MGWIGGFNRLWRTPRRGLGAAVVDENSPVLHQHPVCTDPQAGIDRALPGSQVESPDVPWTRDQRSPGKPELANPFTGADLLSHASGGEYLSLVRTYVAQSEPVVTPVDDEHLAAVDVEDPRLSGNELVGRADVDAHATAWSSCGSTSMGGSGHP